MTEKYPWYCVISSNSPLEQGDFIDSCPIIIPIMELNKKDVEANVLEYNVIIMSQSCDLQYKKVDNILVCPYYSLDEAEKKFNFIKSIKMKNELRKGNVFGHHLLNKCEIVNFKKDYLVVDFRNVYGVPYNLMSRIIKKSKERLRLLPPYREHLSQSFARFFMRVGLPIDIPEFK